MRILSLILNRANSGLNRVQSPLYNNCSFIDIVDLRQTVCHQLFVSDHSLFNPLHRLIQVLQALNQRFYLGYLVFNSIDLVLHFLHVSVQRLQVQVMRVIADVRNFCHFVLFKLRVFVL